VGDRDDALGFAEAAFHLAAILAERVVAAAQGLGGEAEGVGQAVRDLAGFRLQDAAAGNPIFRAQGEPEAEGVGVAE
jgi:hypothetical protein